MDPANDPGRDEYGLPPIDVQIPDDARDLDRDVQAYYRELRAQRRRLRARRIAGPLTRRGMVLPLVAACLAVTLLTGTLLTVLAGRQVSPLPGRAPLSASQRKPSLASPGPELLPNAQVVLDGHQVRLRTLAPAVLAWVPAGCTVCGTLLKQLASQAARVHVAIYFVGSDRAVQDLAVLARQAGPKYLRMVVDDQTGALMTAYGPTRVTAIFAHRDDSVNVVRQLPSRSALQQFTTGLEALAVSDQAAPSGSAALPGTPAPHAT